MRSFLLVILSLAAVTAAHADPCLNLPELGGQVNKLVKEAAPVVRFEIDAGGANFGRQTDGMTWYQDGFPYEIHRNSQTYSAGVAVKVDDKTKVHAGYRYLGKVTSSAVASASDENYLSCRNDHSKCWPLSHWYGTGNVQELYLTASHEFDVHGMRIIGEVGAKAYRPTWNMTIPDWRPTADGPSQFLQVHHDPKIQYGYILGVGLQVTDKSSVMLSVEPARADHDEFPAIYTGKVIRATVRHEF